jgi:DNA-binding MarR family transcriptional regulator
MALREMFPLGDLDDTVVAEISQRLPGLPTEAIGAAFALGKSLIGVLEAITGIVEQHGVSPARWRLLMALMVQAPTEGGTMGELAGHLGVKEPTVTATVDRLASEGLVRRTKDAADGRVVRVTLTDDGRSLVQAALPNIVGSFATFVEAMGGPEQTRASADQLNRATSTLVPGETT